MAWDHHLLASLQEDVGHQELKQAEEANTMKLVLYGKRDESGWATCTKIWAGAGRLGSLLHGDSIMVPMPRAGSSICIFLPHPALPAFDIRFVIATWGLASGIQPWQGMR